MDATAAVLPIDSKHSLPLVRMRRHLLGDESAEGGAVDYMRFLGRFRLRNPALEPIYPLHECLLALLHRTAGASGNGDAAPARRLSLARLESACKLLSSHFGEAAALAADVEALLTALGPVGTAARAAGSIEIDAVAAAFEMDYAAAGGDRQYVFALQHRLARMHVEGLARGS